MVQTTSTTVSRVPVLCSTTPTPCLTNSDSRRLLWACKSVLDATPTPISGPTSFQVASLIGVFHVSHSCQMTPTCLRFHSDIQKFACVLKIIKALEPLFAVISVDAMLRMFRFSQVGPPPSYRCTLIHPYYKDFGEVVVYPLVALFFGTGNQTPFISSAILERVFMDPSMRLVSSNSTSIFMSQSVHMAFGPV